MNDHKPLERAAHASKMQAHFFSHNQFVCFLINFLTNQLYPTKFKLKIIKCESSTTQKI